MSEPRASAPGNPSIPGPISIGSSDERHRARRHGTRSVHDLSLAISPAIGATRCAAERTPRARTLLAASCLAAALLAPALAAPNLAAAGAGLVAVIGKGKGKGPDLDRLVGLAETAARDAGWTLAASSLDASDTRAATTCIELDRPLPCLAALISPRGADRVLLLKVGAAAEDSAVLQLTAIVVLGSHGAPSIAERFCRTCDETQVGAAVHELVRTSIQNAAITAGGTVVAITASAPGAWIYLDGNLLAASSAAATTRARAATFPGAHTATVEKAGFRTQILDITVREGETAEVTAELRAEGTPAAPSARRPPGPGQEHPSGGRWRRPLGWSLVGVGATSALVGASLFLLDEDQPPLGQPRGPRYLDSARFGAGLMLGGALVAGGGAAYLWLTRAGRARRPGTAVSLPSLTPLPGGLAAGWSKAF
jgi:hypothetical protein